MSLTPAAILASRCIYLLFHGAGKHAAYTRARQPGPVQELPLRRILQQQETPVEVFHAP